MVIIGCLQMVGYGIHSPAAHQRLAGIGDVPQIGGQLDQRFLASLLGPQKDTGMQAAGNIEGERHGFEDTRGRSAGATV